MITTYQNQIPLLNKVEEIILTNSEITAAYSTLKNLGTEYLYTGIAIYSSLDQDIKLKFINGEVTILAGTSRAIDGFRYNGLIQQKYDSAAPTTGVLQVLFF